MHVQQAEPRDMEDNQVLKDIKCLSQSDCSFWVLGLFFAFLCFFAWVFFMCVFWVFFRGAVWFWCCGGFLLYFWGAVVVFFVWVGLSFLRVFLFAGVLSLFLNNKEMLKIYLYKETKRLITSTLVLKSKVAIVKQNYFLTPCFFCIY